VKAGTRPDYDLSLSGDAADERVLHACTAALKVGLAGFAAEVQRRRGGDAAVSMEFAGFAVLRQVESGQRA
jgi:hypothetical protein